MPAVLLSLAMIIGGCVDTESASQSTTSATTVAQPMPATPSSQAVEDARRGAALVRLDHVVDGDTIAIASGERVRLAQIDTPEKYGHEECYGRQASVTLARLLPVGTRVRLVRDPALDDRDRYGRLVRYVYVGSSHVNVAMVRMGAASVWFYEGVEGAYSRELVRSARSARRAGRGVWGACPVAKFDPYRGFSSGAVGISDAAQGAKDLDRPHQNRRIPAAPPYPPDVDCSDLSGPVRVTADDPHNLDRDGDGIGCDS